MKADNPTRDGQVYAFLERVTTEQASQESFRIHLTSRIRELFAPTRPICQ